MYIINYNLIFYTSVNTYITKELRVRKTGRDEFRKKKRKEHKLPNRSFLCVFLFRGRKSYAMTSNFTCMMQITCVFLTIVVKIAL